MKYSVCLKEPHREVKPESDREKQDLKHSALLGSMDGVLWGSQAKVGLVNSNQKSYIW